MRMGSELPKQFMLLKNKPVLMHTLEAFYRYDPEIHIIVVLPEDQQLYWKDLCDKFDFRIKYEVVSGGESRWHSVRNGLGSIPEEEVLVGIHDGVRPLVSLRIIEDAYKMAGEKGSAFPVIPVTDTLREYTPEGLKTVSRENYFLVQTPQVFRSEIVLKAYRQVYSASFTDDVSVVEASGEPVIYTLPGEKENLKITSPVDLIIAEALLNL